MARCGEEPMVGGADELDGIDRSRFRAMVLGSAVAHVLLLAFLFFGPALSPPPPGIPGVVVVDLVTMAPGLSPAPAAAPKPVAPKPAPPKPKPKPVPQAKPIPPPEPVAPPKPPPPVVNKTVLPKEAMAKPKPVPKAAPKPEPKQVDYDDLMKDLREETGEERPEAVQQAASGAAASTSTLPTGGLGGTVKVSPEVMAWIRDTRIHVRKNWVKAPGFQRLQTQLSVNLDAAGNVVGEPRVIQRSGNPYYDDSVVRAIQKASPLPKPPRAGERPFVFPSEES